MTDLSRAIAAMRSGKWNELTRHEWREAADAFEAAVGGRGTQPLDTQLPDAEGQGGAPTPLDDLSAAQSRGGAVQRMDPMGPLREAVLALVEEHGCMASLRNDAAAIAFWSKHREALR